MKILSLLIVVTASAGNLAVAAKPIKVSDAEVQELRISELINLIDTLGKGKTDVAIEKIETLLPKPFPKENAEPFGAKSRWIAALGPFKKRSNVFESADVVGIQSLSSQSKVITIVAISENGPILFTFGVFQFGGKYRLGNLTFISDWARFGFHIATIKDRRTRHFSLTTGVATKNSSTSKN